MGKSMLMGSSEWQGRFAGGCHCLASCVPRQNSSDPGSTTLGDVANTLVQFLAAFYNNRRGMNGWASLPSVPLYLAGESYAGWVEESLGCKELRLAGTETWCPGARVCQPLAMCSHYPPPPPKHTHKHKHIHRRATHPPLHAATTFPHWPR